jgi:hypothetical protein
MDGMVEKRVFKQAPAGANRRWRWPFRFAAHIASRRWLSRHNHTRMKKIAVTGLAIGLLIIATLLFWHHTRPSGDAAIRQKLIGSWGSENPAIKGAVTFSSDGSFAVNETFGLGTNTHPVQYAGTWQIEDGYLVMRTAQGSSGGVHVEPITRQKIIHVNSQELVFRDEHAGLVTRKRSQ